MEECKVCGRKNPIEGANFCYYCGAALTDRGGLSAVEPQGSERQRSGKRKSAGDMSPRGTFRLRSRRNRNSQNGNVSGFFA